MDQNVKWIYYVASCYYKVTKAGVLGVGRQGHWVLSGGKELPLADGLNAFGVLGYELVGIHAVNMQSGGEVSSWYQPDFYYIFKKPLGAP